MARGLTPYARDQLLDAVWNADTTGLPAGDLYIQLHSGDPGASGTSNVVSVARQQIAMGASASGAVTNTSLEDFTSMPTTTVVAWSAWDAAGSGTPPTGGNCWWVGWLEVTAGVFAVETADLTANDITSPSHGLANDHRIVFEDSVDGGSLPGGITEGTVYWVLAVTTDTFTISTTQDGTAVDITSSGSGAWRRVDPRAAASSDTFRVQPGELVVYLEA